MKLRTLGLCLLVSACLYSQAVSPINPQNLTTTYLNNNKMRYWTGGWQTTQVYNSQDVVTYLGAAYVSLQRGNVGNSPLLGEPWWDVLSAGGGGGGGGAVSSIFGRIGNIVATAGDYTAAQITNAVSTASTYNDPPWITGLNWSKLLAKPTFYYQAVQWGGVPQLQRNFLNFSSNFVSTDNSGANQTSLDLASVISSSTTGNALTATGFATAPAQCTANQYAFGITPLGAANCSFIAYSQLTGAPTLRYQQVGVNSGTQNQHTRVNFIQGQNVTITPVDNGATDSTDVTISATAGAGGYTTISENGTNLTQRSQVNYSTEFAAVDNAGAGRTDISVAAVTAGKISGLAPSATTDATNASNITSGRLALARGGTVSDLSLTGGPHMVLEQTATGVAITVGQLGATDISGLAPSATTDTTSATNITSGTLGGGRLPQFTGGQVTSSGAGSVNLQIGAAQVTNAMLAGSIDVTSKLTGITPPANGGTGNAFFGVTGPASTLKTYTLPNASTTIVTTQDTGSVSNQMLSATAVTTANVPAANLQGVGTKFQTSGTISATPGTPLCTADAAGTATTSGCTAGAGTVTVNGAGNLTSTALVTGAGSQALQTPSATATMDSSGNISTPGSITSNAGSSNAGSMALPAGADTAAPANTVGYEGPVTISTAYRIQFPGAPAAGYVKRTNATPSVESVSAIAAADLPLPTASTVGGVESKDCTSLSSGAMVQKINTDGSVSCFTPAGAGTVTTTGSPVANQVALISGSTSITGTATDTTTTHALFATATAPAFRAIAAGDIPTLNQSTTGNAATATALATLPTLCTGGQVPTGILASGNATGCGTTINGTAIPASVTLMATSTTVLAAQMPAFTGDVTKPNGSLATTVTAINGTSVPASAAILGTNTSAQPIALSTLPTSAEPAHTGDMTNLAGSLATTVGRLNGVSLAGLASGVLMNTNGTGVPSIGTPDVNYQTAIARSVKTIGAVCDGVTDDSTALNTAAQTPGTWYFPPNATCIAGHLTSSANNVTWIGLNTTIKHLSTDTANYLLSWTFANPHISGINFDMNGVLQTSSRLYLVQIYQGSGMSLDNVTFLNSGTARPSMGGLDIYQQSGSVQNSHFLSTILGDQLYTNANPTGGKLAIVKNDFTGSQHNALYITGGGAGSELEARNNSFYSITAVDSGNGDCATNTGECGNGIIVYSQAGKTLVQGNHFDSVRFSCVRNNNSIHVIETGNVCTAAGEVGMWLECAGCSAGAAAGEANIVSDNKITDSFFGIDSTNIAGRTIGIPNLITGNSIYNMLAGGIHVENDVAIGNVMSNMPYGLSIGYGGVGFGNLSQGNSFKNVGVATVVDKDLSSTPNNQIGLNITEGATAGDLQALALSAGIAITAISQANPAVVTYTGTDPSNTNVYLLVGVNGMSQINGALCTVASVNTTAKTFQCSGINSSAYTAFVTQPTGNAAAQGFLLYSSGTTAAYSLPSTVALGACLSCVTNASPLTSNAVVIGGGAHATSTIAADTTTTHVLAATAGAPAFRALAAGDLPAALSSSTSLNGVAMSSAVGDATITQTIAHGATAMTTGALAGNTCASATTVAATGVATTDVITFTPNADISAAVGYGAGSAAGLKLYPYPTSGNVNFTVCNGTAVSITVPAMTINWKVIR